jgi:hypothetical protein
MRIWPPTIGSLFIATLLTAHARAAVPKPILTAARELIAKRGQTERARAESRAALFRIADPRNQPREVKRLLASGMRIQLGQTSLGTIFLTDAGLRLSDGTSFDPERAKPADWDALDDARGWLDHHVARYKAERKTRADYVAFLKSLSRSKTLRRAVGKEGRIFILTTPEWWIALTEAGAVKIQGETVEPVDWEQVRQVDVTAMNVERTKQLVLSQLAQIQIK